MAKSRDLSDHLFDVFDSDGNGEIDLNEFTVGLLSLVTGSKRDKVRALFQLIDLDASGAIDHDEFYQLLHFLHVELPKARHVLHVDEGDDTNKIESLSEAQLKTMAGAIISKLDVDGDGEISLDELMVWMDNYPDADVTDLFSLLRSVIESGQ
jgi:Ca2+-binding EF-hand superfamily protein